MIVAPKFKPKTFYRYIQSGGMATMFHTTAPYTSFQETLKPGDLIYVVGVEETNLSTTALRFMVRIIKGETVAYIWPLGQFEEVPQP